MRGGRFGRFDKLSDRKGDSDRKSIWHISCRRRNEKHITMRQSNICAALLAIVCCGVCARAQDRIHLVDSRRVIEAKVIEIGEVDLLYKLYNNLDGPDYRLSLSRIASIDFENGTRQVFAGQSASGPYVDGYIDGYDDGLLDYRWGGYYLGNRRLRGQDLTDYIGYSLYGGKYRKANNQYFWGAALTGIGVLILVGTVTDQLYQSKFNNDPAFQDKFYKDHHSNDKTIGYILGYAAGAACLGTGIPLWRKADRTLNEIADDYNRNYGRRNLGYSSSLSVGSTRSGIGLAFNF